MSNAHKNYQYDDDDFVFGLWTKAEPYHCGERG